MNYQQLNMFGELPEIANVKPKKLKGEAKTR